MLMQLLSQLFYSLFFVHRFFFSIRKITKKYTANNTKRAKNLYD